MKTTALKKILFLSLSYLIINGITLAEEPSNFSLTFPANGETFYCVNCLPSINCCWEESEDPDEGDTVRYDYYAHIHSDDGFDTLIHVAGIEILWFEIETEPYIPGYVDWWVQAISNDDTTECNERWTFIYTILDNMLQSGNQSLPLPFSIESIFPNPFNSYTVIKMTIQVPTLLNLNVFDIIGRKVKSLASGMYPEGNHSFLFDADKLASGVYIVQVEAQGYSKVIKNIVLMK